jgi:hypothetical protein
LKEQERKKEEVPSSCVIVTVCLPARETASLKSTRSTYACQKKKKTNKQTTQHRKHYRNTKRSAARVCNNASLPALVRKHAPRTAQRRNYASRIAHRHLTAQDAHEAQGYSAAHVLIDFDGLQQFAVHEHLDHSRYFWHSCSRIFVTSTKTCRIFRFFDFSHFRIFENFKKKQKKKRIS